MEWQAEQIVRRKSRCINVGGVLIGGDARISVQSMTSTDTYDVKGTVEQILALESAGADLVRVTCPKLDAVEPFKKIVESVHVPVIADIHFDYRLALMAAERGMDKIRINPGNIGGEDHVKAVADAIVRLANMTPEERQEMGAKGKAYVEGNLPWGKLAKEFLKPFES